jgi:hypothetical protein
MTNDRDSIGGDAEHPSVDLTAHLTAAGVASWEAIGQLARIVSHEQWAIVGGMMVTIHGQRYGREPYRTTGDGDIVVDVRSFGRQAMLNVADALNSQGFTTSMSPENVTRFEHGKAKIDLLAPEGMGINPVLTSPPGHAIQAPGTTQALDRTEVVHVRWGDVTTVRVPSLLGAIVAKAAAAHEINSLDQDERRKHLMDLVFLLGIAWTVDTAPMEQTMGKSDRKRISAAMGRIDRDKGFPWAGRDQQVEVRSAVDALLRRG